MASERINAAVELARHYPAARIVYSGGNSNLVVHGLAEAVLAASPWQNSRIAPGRIMLETQSRSTFENAAFTKQLFGPKPGEHWLLITSAIHMRRAIGSFRRVGFPVEAYPVNYRTAGARDLWSISETPLGELHKTDATVPEWLGLLAYLMTGRISHLFPSAP